MDENDVKKTKFVTSRFELSHKDADWTEERLNKFQRAMDVILVSVKLQCAIDYIDIVIIYSKSPEEHVNHIKEVLRLLMAAGMTLKLKKSHFFPK